jgi:hypothetical protein
MSGLVHRQNNVGGGVAKKTKTKADSGTLGDIAEGLGTLLGNAEKQWRAWEGPRNAVVKAVTDVRDRAAALLSEMGAAAEAAAGKGSKKGKKKSKKDKKAEAKKAKADAKQAKAAKAEAEKAKAEKAAHAAKVEKKVARAAKKAGKKAGRKKMVKRAKAAPAPAPEPEPLEASADGFDAGDTPEF